MEKYLLPVDKEKKFIVLIFCLLVINSIYTYIYENKQKYIISSISIPINKSTPEQIMCLPGIGKNKAFEIYFYKLEKGKFNNISELKKVKNVSNSSILKIEKYVKIE